MGLHVRDCVLVCEMCQRDGVYDSFFFALYLIMTFGMSLENGA